MASPKRTRKRRLSERTVSTDTSYSLKISSMAASPMETQEPDDRMDDPEVDASLTPDMEMKRGLFEASRAPAKLKDIRSFQNLHKPRIHGMSEWLLQYENAHKKQDQYLQQIRNLRMQFRSSNDNPRPHNLNTSNLDPFRKRVKVKDFWLPSQNESEPMKFPNQVCVLHPRGQRVVPPLYGDVPSPREGVEFLMAPSSFKSEGSSFQAGQSLRGEAHIRLPPIGDLDRHETDYEPIEDIAQRNKLNLNKYLKSNKRGRKTWAQVRPRNTMDVSDVFIQATKVP